MVSTAQQIGGMRLSGTGRGRRCIGGFRRWSTDGTSERLLAHVQIHDDVGADQSITS
jgi:hypothetical protein